MFTSQKYGAMSAGLPLEPEKAEPDFMAEREDVVSDEGRFDL